MEVRIVVTGSRDWTSEEAIRHYLLQDASDVVEGLISWQDEQPPFDMVLIHGDCPTGADQIAAKLAAEWGWEVRPFPADWSIGLRAGPIRNDQMLDEDPHLVSAYHDNLRKSKGTLDCVSKAAGRGIEVHLHGSLASSE